MAKKLSMIVAASTNDVIGVADDLPWRLSADLKRFKSLTMGHPIIMGRKTFESIGRLLPGRRTIIVTRNTGYEFPGAIVAHSIEDAMASCDEDSQPFIIGGAEIYRLALPKVNEIHLTRVQATIEGDTYLPEIDWDQWELVEAQEHTADAKNQFACVFEHYRRVESV